MNIDKKKINGIMRRKNGAALILVVILLLVLSITSVAILAVSLTENKTEIYQNKRTQAYYLAWSGANSVGEWIVKNPASALALNGKTSTNSSNFSNGTVDVAVNIESATGHVLVYATGNVSDVSNSVQLRLQQMNSNLLLDRAIYSNAPLDISGMEVSGDVQSGGNISYSTNGKHTYVGDAYPNEWRYYELADFPNPPMYIPSSVVVKNSSLTIYGSGNSFVSIDVEQNGTLNLNPTGVMQIVVDNMTIDSDLNIDATNGRVELYINQSLTVTTKGVINNTIPSNLVIFLKDGSTFYMQANKVLKGYIIGPQATMEIQSNSSTTNGALITNVIRKNVAGQGPNGAVNYVPPESYLDLDDILFSYRILRWE